MAAQQRFEADKNLASLGFCSLNLVRWADDEMAKTKHWDDTTRYALRRVDGGHAVVVLAGGPGLSLE